MKSLLKFTGAALIGAGMLMGCAQVDKSSAKAQTGAPESAQVEIVQFPYNPNLPIYVVAVEPFGYGASGMTSGNTTPDAPSARGGVGGIVGGGLRGGDAQADYKTQSGPGSQVGYGMSAQMITALTNCGNIAVVDLNTLTRSADGTYTGHLQDGEVGPFVIRGMVTEFNETAELEEKKRGGSLGGLGAGVGLLGAVTGNKTVRNTGAGVAVANPTYENQEARRSGMVGMDMQLYDGRTGRILRGYTANGTFTSVSATSGASLFGIGGGDAAFASSALGQATRAAMNEAITETYNTLKSRVPAAPAAAATTTP